MKITKYLHSCLYIQEQDKAFLIDPGNYSCEDHALRLNSLEKLDYLLITHEHPDHMHLPLIKEVLNKFPRVKIISNFSVKNLLEKEGINVLTEGNEFIKITPVPHEKIWMGKPPQNVMFTLFNKFTDPGDSLSFINASNYQTLLAEQRDRDNKRIKNEDNEILALPIQAPWGSTMWAIETALKIKPKIIIPIHDWHWKDNVRISMYERLEEYFSSFDIRFLKPITGVSMEI